MSGESYRGRTGSFPSYRGYSISDYQEETVVGSILGSTEMSIAAFVRPKNGIAASQPIAGTADFTSNTGWQLAASGTPGRFEYIFHDSLGNITVVNERLYDPTYNRPLWHLVAARQYSSGGVTNADLYVNASLLATAAAPASGATIAGAFPFRIGFNAAFNDIAEFLDIGPVAYLGGPVTQELFELGMDKAMKRRSFIADSVNGVPWSDIWLPRIGEGSNDCSYFTRTGLVTMGEVGTGLTRTSPHNVYA